MLQDSKKRASMTEQNTPAAAPTPVTAAAPAASTPEPLASVAVDAATPSPAPATDAVVTEAVKAPETVLGAEPPKEPVKAPDVKPEEVKADVKVEPKKEEAAQSDEPAPLPTYEAFKLPEGISLEGEGLSEFTKELAEFQTNTKAEQAAVQEFGQKLVDRHVAEVQTAIKRLNDHYAQSWEKQKIEWKDQFVKDPEIGGNRQETTVKAALDFIRTHGGTESQQQEFRQLMETTGIGNHPAMIRLLAKANMNMSEGKPLPATKPSTTVTSKVSRRYGETS